MKQVAVSVKPGNGFYKRTPVEWEKLLGMKILDPDGWRSDGKSFDDPITKKEFLDRSVFSTQSFAGPL